MPDDSAQDLRLLVRAATMYHLEGATQAEIATRLGVSRPTAGRLVARARAQGLVRIVVEVPPELSDSVHTDLERDLEQRFSLDEVLVIDDEVDGSRGGYAALGRAGASVLVRRLTPPDTLGFTWGPETVAVADALDGRSASCLRVVQMDGSVSTTDYQTGVERILTGCAHRLSARPLRLTAPLYADTGTVSALEADSVVSQALTAARESDVMMFGVGTVSTSGTLFAGAFVDAAVLDELADLGAVGEIGGHFYDAAGRPVVSSLTGRTVSVGLDVVRDCPTTILLSGGPPRYESILGALRGGLATVLVTDIGCATWLAGQEPALATTPKRKADQ